MSTSGAGSATGPKRVVFLGTPAVAARSLDLMLDASATSDPASSFEIIRVVSQPPAPVGRKKVLTPSPVHALADERGVPVLTPPSAKDEGFLAELEELAPDLCVTAAYGCFLPKRFLAIPAHGTLNIHPSLLPLYRGAAPVQRCLEAGDARTGVSVLFTVLQMDAGPIVSQTSRELTGDEQAPELLLELFEQGTADLLGALPSVWAGDAASSAKGQDDASATHAPKVGKDEAAVSLDSSSAREVHNKVRAFAEWPGTTASLEVSGTATEVKLCMTGVPAAPVEVGGGGAGSRTLWFDGDALAAECGDGSVLHIKELQAAGRKRVDARSFWNGLQDKENLRWLR